MKVQENTQKAAEAVRKLEEAYQTYAAARQEVLQLGDAAIPALLAALNPRAIAAADALKYLIHLPAADMALPRLVDWAIGQWPLHTEVVEALVRAGPRALPHILDRLEVAAAQEDDEAVRNLLETAVRMPEPALAPVVEAIVALLRHTNAHIREAAADAVWHLGLPHGRSAFPILVSLSQTDTAQGVRDAARTALTRLGFDS
jgi:hypothetical protein